MAGKHTDAVARRVVTGLDEAGRSVIVEDGETPSRVVTDAFTINQVWQVDFLPSDVLTDDASAGQVSIAPPAAGFVYLLTTFPPDSEWDLEAGYGEALAQSGDAGSHVDNAEIAGLHETDTVDIVTVVSGELYAVLEGAETLLKPGDSLVQRGTRHTWSNRGDEPCTIVAVMMGATR